MLHLTEENFDEHTATGVTLVDFYAEWCGPCKILGKLMPHLAEKYEGTATVAKVNTEEQLGLAQRFQISALPTVVVFKDGKQVDRKRGLLPPEAYSELIDSWLTEDK